MLVLTAAPAAAQEMRPLTLAEIVQAFDGGFACRSPDNHGACSSVIYVIASDGESLTVRETGLNVIRELIAAPLPQRVLRLPLYARYADLFSALEVQRARGDFRYLKHYETATGRYDLTTHRICAQTGAEEGVAGLEFFFSNTITADTSADEPLEPSLEARLREFMVDVMRDPDYRSYVVYDDVSAAELDTLTGAREYCVAYAGGVVDGRVQLRGMLVNSGEIALPSMNDVLEIRLATETPRLIEE
jgi:hypothetical protein